MEKIRCDALIVGGGLAGLFAVLHLPESWNVVVVDKGSRGAGSSPLAQGGMAVAVGPDDSPSLHAEDTLRVGCAAGAPKAIDVLVNEAPDVLHELVALGCEFDRDPDGSWDLHREGGQSVARSVHRADATGRELMRIVVEHARTRAHRVVGSALGFTVANGRCTGATIGTAHGPLELEAPAVLLATGGCGALWDATTNAEASTGDGMAAAFEAGAEVSGCELVQFHPTVLAVPGRPRVLLTEALRGAGARLLDASGEPFMTAEHPDGDLAPRDVVARAILMRGGAFLDAVHLGRTTLDVRFPNVVAAVAAAGFDLAAEPVPVEPAAHYLLGGVVTDTEGRTTLDGLWAAGECAWTGVHGANRMAGNSLAEAVVFGRRAAQSMVAECGPDGSGHPAPSTILPAAHTPPPPSGDDESWRRLRSAMTLGAGLVRTAGSLAAALNEIEAIDTTDDSLRLACVAASLVCRSALEREESRGVHYRADAPQQSPEWDGRHVTLVVTS